MAASAMGSGLIALAALVVVCAGALLLLRYFLPLRSTPAFLLVPIFLSLVLPISTVLLVPIDLASSTRGDDGAGPGIWLPQRAILVAWRITYWLMFALTWLILPLLGEYLDSGYRKPADRIVYSLKSNGRFWLIVIACSVVAGVYVFVTVGMTVKGVVMALAYCVGLIQAIYMMGHGLVAIPRRLIRNANISGRLRRLQSQAPKAHEQKEDALIELADLEEQLKQLRRKSDLSAEHRAWVDDIVDVTHISQSRTAATATSTGNVVSPPNVITDRYLAELTRRIIRARHKRSRFIAEWEKLKQDAHDVQAILDAHGSHQLTFPQSSLSSTIFSRNVTLLSPRLRFYLHAKILPAVRLALAAVLALASVGIVWSELAKVVAPRFSIISLTVLHQADGAGNVGFSGQIMTAFWIFYMCSGVLVSFRDVKVWGNRALVRRNTYGESACWYAGQLAKLTVPLAYNFLTFIPFGIREHTTFYQFLGQLIDITPLGDWFDNLFPVFVLFPVCATLFNLYGRIQRVVRLDLVDDADEHDSAGSSAGGWREGRALIAADDEDGMHVDSSGLLGSVSAPPERADAVTPRSRRSQPSIYIPPEDGAASRRAPTPAQRISAATRAAEEEDENVFSGFAHRFQNTIDSVERPEWLKDLGKKPKWMNNLSGDGESSGSSDFSRNWGRLFGGRPSDGQVRL